MGKQLFSNNGKSQLAADITDIATSLTVLAGEGDRFPAITGSQWFKITLEDSLGNIEIMKVTARSGDTFTVERAVEDAARYPAKQWLAGDSVELRLTSEGLDQMQRRQWRYVTSNATADAGDKIVVDSSVASLTITLPAVPVVGDEVSLFDPLANNQVNYVYIDGQGAAIEGNTTSTPKFWSATPEDTSLVYIGGITGWKERGPGIIRFWHPVTEAHIARMTDTSDAAMLEALDAMVTGLDSDGILSRIEQLCVLQLNATDTLLNIVGNTDAISVNAPTFSTTTGFYLEDVDGTITNAKYIDCGIAPSASSQIALSDKHYFAYVTTAITAQDIGEYVIAAGDNTLAFDGIYLETVSTGTDSATWMADAWGAADSSKVYVEPLVGFIGGTQQNTAATAQVASTQASTTYASISQTAVPTTNVMVGVNQTFGPIPRNHNVACWGFGAGLTAAELNSLYQRIQQYMTDIGAAV